MLTFIQQPIFWDFSASEKEKEKKNTTSHMYIPTGRSVPRTEDLLSWSRIDDWFECTGSAVMDVDVYWKELDRWVKGKKKKLFLSKQKNIIFAYIIFVVCFAWLLFVLWICYPQKCSELWFFFFFFFFCSILMKVWVF